MLSAALFTGVSEAGGRGLQDVPRVKREGCIERFFRNRKVRNFVPTL